MLQYPFNTAPAKDVDVNAVEALADGPVARARMGQDAELWLALSHATVRQVLSDQRFSREAAMGPQVPVLVRAGADPDLLPSMDPPRHARVRRLVAKAFSPRMVDRLAPRMQQVVDDLLAGIEEHGPPADLVELYTEPLPIMVICELMGVPYEDRSQFRAWTERLTASATRPAEEFVTAITQIRQYLRELIAVKRADPAEDLTTELIWASDAGDVLSESELVANLQLLLIAGHETTVNQLGNSLVALLRHPDQLALLRDHPELAKPAVDELLRYVRLVSSTLPRVTVDDVELGGQHVKSGEPVVAMISAANHDPAVFTEPARLDLTRENAALHMSFGHGTHYCLGAHLARLELRMALTSLLGRYPGLRLAVDESKLRWREGTPLRALLELPVGW